MADAPLTQLAPGTLVRITDQRRAESQYMERFVALHGALMVVKRRMESDDYLEGHATYLCKSLATGKEIELFRMSLDVADNG